MFTKICSFTFLCKSKIVANQLGFALLGFGWLVGFGCVLGGIGLGFFGVGWVFLVWFSFYLGGGGAGVMCGFFSREVFPALFFSSRPKAGSFLKSTHLDSLTITSLFEEKLFLAVFIAAAISSCRQNLCTNLCCSKHNMIEIEA